MGAARHGRGLALSALHCQVEGAGDPVVLLHGGAGTLHDFDAQRALLAQTRQVISLEQMGHGRTPHDPTRQLTYEVMAEDTAGALARLNVARADFVGWSDGGQIALLLAATRTELVKSVCAIGVGLGAAALRPGPKRWIARAKPDDFPAEQRALYARLSPDAPAGWAALVDRVRALWLAERWGVTEDQLRAIAAPVLIAQGDDDLVPVEHALQLTRLIRDAKLCILPASDHFLLQKRAALINPILLDWLK